MPVVTSSNSVREIPGDLVDKVRRCGLELEDAQWRAMPPAARDRLVQMPVTNAVERHTFVGVLKWLTETFRAA